MIIYDNKHNYEDIINKYNHEEISKYLNELGSLSNISVTYFNKTCILYGLDVFIINKTSSKIYFVICPGRFLLDGILYIIDEYLFLDTDINLSEYYIQIIHGDKPFKCLINIVSDPIESSIILAGFRLIYDSIGYKIYSYIYTHDYFEYIQSYLNESISIERNSLTRIGYSYTLDNYIDRINNKDIHIRPIIPVDSRILSGLYKFLNDNNPIAKYFIPDSKLVFNKLNERITRLSNLFSENYDQFY